MNKLVACNEFVKRQTKASGYSHFEGSWEELENMTAKIMESNPDAIKPGYKDGVVLVEFWGSHSRFQSAVVELNIFDKLTATYSTRRLTEAPYIKISVAGKKQPAKYASVVLYRKDILAENNEATTDAEWEIVCIKARTSEKEEPMDPYTMARNFLHMTGGTKGEFTAQQFAESIVYWNNHAMCHESLPWYNKLGRWIRQCFNDAGLHFWNNLKEIK